MKKGYFLIVISGLIMLGIVIITIAMLVSTMPVEMESLPMRVGMALVLTFLVLLIVRYFVLIWLGYLQHIENQFSHQGDGFEPPVTLIVPAYNEGSVIQAAVRSLLDLDYPSYEILVIDDGSNDDTYA